MVNAKRSINNKYWDGEYYTFQGVLIGFPSGGKSFLLQQDNDEVKCLPLSMVTFQSLHKLRQADLNKVITLQMATGMCRKTGLKILEGPGEKKQNVVKLNTNTEKEVVMEEKAAFVIDTDDTPLDPTRLTYKEVLEKMNQLGALYVELKNGKYASFSMSGNDLMMRPLGSAKVDQFIK